jgi:hypothetical protein
MKYLKTFEDYEGGTDFGRFSSETDNNEWMNDVHSDGDDMLDDEDDLVMNDDEVCPECGCRCVNCGGDEDCEPADAENTYGHEEEEEEEKNWGDEIVEKKKMNAGFKAYLDKQKAKKSGKSDDKKDDKKESKGSAKGLTTGQRKLPKKMQDAILKKQGK